ncbi:MAG TPA: histidinol dehydrogenase, partial [Pirellulaceae bacterium]
GNLFVALAKKSVFGTVDIDSLAGPSEVVVLADDSAPVEYVASDLLAQAEHAPGASILITWSSQLADRLGPVLEQQLSALPRRAVIGQSLLEFSAAVLTRDADQGCLLADLIAPEHLHIATQRPGDLADRIRNAGAIFLGHETPVALGDYTAGPSHVLPTGGTARWASGLSVNTFLRSHCVIEYTREAVRAAAESVETLAKAEGLTAHAQSVLRRTDRESWTGACATK